MSRRHIIPKFQLWNQEDSSASPITQATDVSSVDFITYHLTVDSSVTGELAIYFCNDRQQFDINNAVQLNFDPPMLINGAAESNYMIEIQNKGLKYLYIEFNDGGGSGNIDAWISGVSRGA